MHSFMQFLWRLQASKENLFINNNALLLHRLPPIPDIPCFAEEVILHSEADLHGHEEITDGVALNNIYEVALENEIYLDQGPSIK